MKKIILALALMFTTVSANALDVTTCNPELLKVISEIKSPNKQQREALIKVLEIQTYKVEVLKALANKMKAKMDAGEKEVQAAQKSSSNSIDGLAKLSSSAGKMNGHIDMVSILMAELNAYYPCVSKTSDILNAK